MVTVWAGGDGQGQGGTWGQNKGTRMLAGTWMLLACSQSGREQGLCLSGTGGQGPGSVCSHLPLQDEVPGEGTFIQGVVFRQENARALGKEAGKSRAGS